MSRNGIVAEIQGTDLAHELVMVGAHMDLWHAGVGATDNGAGNSMALEVPDRVRESGKARAIGVSNFPTALWKRTLELARVPVNQVEFHLFLDQSALMGFARERDLRLVASRPIAKGKVAEEEPAIVEVARRHERTPAQVALRWVVQQGVSAIPKSSRRDHLKRICASSTSR